MATGTIASYNSQNHFGFIQPSDGSKQIYFNFVHTGQDYQGFTAGDAVTYDLADSGKGLQPANVQKV